ncbi:reprolysin-like metallopeptidase [Flavobacterium sp.]|uniref:zinc-dependent metalloprotease n=1 Tax=Flavobacterium sp. TaxID=239 RepID=UPI0028BE9948|nr:zinc-dependent metalloprotease family protein [Flavobacterium sp.]
MKRKLTLAVLVLFSVTIGFAQSQKLWNLTNENNAANLKKVNRSSFPRDYHLFTLDLETFKNQLIGAPVRGEFQGISNLIIELPNAEGVLEHYRVMETPIMEAPLAAKFPMIKSYAAQGIEDPTAVARFSVTQFGLHSMTLSGAKSTAFIDPYTEDRLTYIVYSKESLQKESNDFSCLTDHGVHLPSLETDRNASSAEMALHTDDKKLRTYRLAQSCTVEYGNLFAGTGTPAQRKANIQAQMAITMTRVNGVYEKDLAITMIFVANNDLIIYYGAAGSDPWNGEYNTQTGITIDANIGFNNYDIGHNFNTSGGGNAGCIGCICSTNTTPSSGFHKGTGFTGRANPTGDAFDIDYVAHEMGHQFGGYHTQSNNSCRSGSGLTEVETGSGSSIMGYAGICAANVQANSDDFFGYVNIRDIMANVKTGVSSTCAQITNFANNPPTADAGRDYVIPRSTAFILTGSGTDPDGDAITYTWEQNDPENPNSNAAPVATRAAGPMFRSVRGTTSPSRYMPNLTTVLAGNTANTWEVCPSVGRNLNFSLTVRDNRAGGGQTATDLMRVTVNGTAGPFVVNAPNTNVTWQGGTNQNVTWAVAGTTANGVNAAYVDIYLSTNGGTTFTTLLASKVPNDGSETVTIPNIPGNQNRIMVRGYDNIFYDVSNTNFTISAAASTFTAEFNGVAGQQNKSICTGATISYTIDYKALGGFSGTTSFAVAGNPAGTTVVFSPTTMNSNGTVTMTVNNTTGATPGFYTLAVTATSGAVTKNVNFYLDLLNSNFGTTNLSTPANNAVGQNVSLNLTWAANSNASGYNVEVATDSGFTNIISTGTTNTTSYTVSGLTEGTNYFWRVQPFNVACIGTFTSSYRFTTGVINCIPFASTNVPLTISATGTPTINSTLTIPVASGGIIGDVNVTMNVSHTWINDLTATLISPAGTQVQLYVNPCVSDAIENIVATFDDSGSAVVCGTNPGISGTVLPTQALAALNGEVSNGTWTLRIADAFNQDGGSLNSWSLNICTVAALGTTNNNLSNFVIYPNPNNGTFNVRFTPDASNETEIVVFDISGRKIYQKNYAKAAFFEEPIQLQSAQSGVYLVTVKNGAKQATQKIVIR